MKNATPLYTTALIVALAASPAFAETDKATASAGEPAAITAEPLYTPLQISGIARSTFSGIQMASQALTAGESAVAKEIINDINNLFSDNDADLIVKTDKGFGLPIDQGVALPEGFVPTEAHKPTFAAADVLMQAGDIDGVIATFKEAGIELVSKVAVLPYAPTVDGLQKVLADIDAGELDKAGSDLQSLLTAVIVERFAIDAPPVQGYTPAEITQS